MNGLTPICPHCGKFSAEATGKEIYPHRADLWQKKFYRCQPCGAYVGCHTETGRPLGTLADAKLRKLRSLLHQVFDPIWENAIAEELAKPNAKPYRGLMMKHRTAAYINLAVKMGLPIEECHIAMFDEAQCRKAVDLINSGEIYRHERTNTNSNAEARSSDQAGHQDQS